MDEDDDPMRNMGRLIMDIVAAATAVGVCAAGGAVASNSITLGAHSVQLEQLERAVDRLPPEWLKKEIAEIKAIINKIDERQRKHEIEHTR